MKIWFLDKDSAFPAFDRLRDIFKNGAENMDENEALSNVKDL